MSPLQRNPDFVACVLYYVVPTPSYDTRPMTGQNCFLWAATSDALRLPTLSEPGLVC